MKIVLINRSDLNGGAAVFTYRLTNAFLKNNIEATMLVTDKKSSSQHVVSYANRFKDGFHFLFERLQIFTQNKLNRKNLFKVDTADFGRDLSTHPKVLEADVIILNWINQGALSLNSIQKICNLGKPVIWTMHDMWCCTGICHHAYECIKFKDQCGECPYLSSGRPNDLSHSTWHLKKELYTLPNLHFVAVSNWLAEKCKESSLLKHHPIHVIPNTTSINDFTFDRLPNEDYQIDNSKQIITIGAARLDDPVKGFPLLLDSLHELKKHYPQIAQNCHLILYGGIKDPTLLQLIPIAYTYLGKVNADAVNRIMAHSDVILSTSHFESFGGTLIEGMAAGCIPVTFGNGGQTDIVTHMSNGYVAHYPSTSDFAKGIVWALSSPVQRAKLHTDMLERFSEHSVVKQYLQLISKINTKSLAT